MASTVGRVQNLVVENGEVESQTQADGVSRGQLGLGDIGSALGKIETASVTRKCCDRRGQSYLVRLVRGSGGNLALLARGELGEVAVVVTLPVKHTLVRDGTKGDARARGRDPE